MRRNVLKKYRTPLGARKPLPIKSSLGIQHAAKRERRIVPIKRERRPSRLLPLFVSLIKRSGDFVLFSVKSLFAVIVLLLSTAARLLIIAPLRLLFAPFKLAAFRITLMLFAIGLIGYKTYEVRSINEPQLAMDLAYWPEAAQEQPYIPDLPLLNSSSIVHTVRKGDSLASIAVRYGFRAEEVAGLNEALKNFDPKDASHQKLQPGQAVEMTLGEVGFSGVKIPSTKAVTLVIERDSKGQFRSKLEKMQVEHRERVASGIITSSFAAAAQKTGVAYDIVDDLVDLFSDRVNFHQDFQVGDRFVIIYRDQVLESGESVGVGAILAAALYLQSKRLVATRYVGADGKARYFDEKQQFLGNGILRYPLKFTRISSYFSQSRFHPVLKTRKPHNGVDFAAPVGTPVRSVANGKILLAGMSGPNGIMIKIQHNERYSTAYLHLSKLAPGVKRGATVTRGQVIGAVGTTGRSTGPHLHYSFYDRGRYLDPLKITLPTIDILDRGMRIDKTYLNRVLYTLEQYEQVNPRS